MKIFKRILLIVFSVCLIVSCAGFTLAYTADGEPTVLYDGRERSLTVLNTEGSDLFTNMKDLMPGDSRVQEVSLQAKNLTGTVSIWLKADCDAETAQALEELTLSVYADGKLISSGPAGSSENLSSGVELYSFTSDKTVPLRIELDVPVQVGNELAGAQEHLQWTFTVQDDSGSSVIPPQTGERSGLTVWIALMIISFAGIACTALFTKKQDSADKSGT